MPRKPRNESVVVTGIGLVTALGNDRESTWQAIINGQCGVKPIRPRREIPSTIKIAAEVNYPINFKYPDRLPAIHYAEVASLEAIEDSHLDLESLDPTRMGIGISSHMGDIRPHYKFDGVEPPEQIVPWWEQWLPSSLAGHLSSRYSAQGQSLFQGPKLCYSTACASSLIAMIQSIRAIRRGDCDIMLTGGGEGIDSLFASGFQSMRALSKEADPKMGCRPFDVERTGFVMGEGSGFLVLESESHAVARGAKIYARVLSEKMAGQAHHIAGLDMEDESLIYLINQTIQSSGMAATDFDYINAHGTGTAQNDIVEINCINSVFKSHVDSLNVSSTKSQIGHLLNAAGAAEMAITILGLRDGISPPTVNLHNPESNVRFNCVANQSQKRKSKIAMKLAMAFGGHLAGIAMQRYDDCANAFEYPQELRKVA